MSILTQATLLWSTLRPNSSRKPVGAGAAPAGETARGVVQDREKYARYLEVCGFPAGDTVPATWLHLLTFELQTAIMAAKDWPFRALGTVHVTNEMRQFRPVHVEEIVDISVHVGDYVPHEKGTIFSLNEVITVEGRIAWVGRSDYLARGYSVPGAPQEIGRETLPEAEPSATQEVSAGLGRAYAKVSGDFNPIHLSNVSARMFGMKSAVAHGMWTHGWALAQLGSELPDAFETRVQFARPVPLPSKIHFLQEGERYGVVGEGRKPLLAGYLRPLVDEERGVFR